jgi:hypothetical protein
LKACPTGTHLPTMREIAEYCTALGAKGILEIADVNPGAIPKDYLHYQVTNSDNSQEEFYFNEKGYQRPNGDLGKEFFWTSSLDSFVKKDGWALSLYGYSGFFYIGDPIYSSWNAVRCIQ